MTSRNVLSICMTLILSSLAIAAMAQTLAPAGLVGERTLPAGYNCTFESPNNNVGIDADGVHAVEIPGVSADEPFRLRVICVDTAGNTVEGQTSLIFPVAGGDTEIGDVSFENLVPVPRGLSVSPASFQLVGAGESLQLTVIAELDGDVFENVTNVEGTFYSSSDPAVVEVSRSGKVTAMEKSGKAIITVLREGRLGVAVTSVLEKQLSKLKVTPARIELVPHELFRAVPVAELDVFGCFDEECKGGLTVTESDRGTTYTSDDPTVAEVDPDADGLVKGRGAGEATITVRNGSLEVEVPVTVRERFTLDKAPVVAIPIRAPVVEIPPLPLKKPKVDIAGPLIFVAADDWGLWIYDYDSRRASVSFVANLGLGGPVLDARARGSLVAVGLGGAGGIALVDVADPHKPSVLKIVADSGAVRDLWLSSDLLYAAAADKLVVYDVSDPRNPQPVGEALGFAKPVRAVAGDAFRNLAVALTAEPALEVVDITPEKSLRWLAKVPLPSSPERPGTAKDVFLHGSTAYVANGRASLHAIDLSDPNNPRRGPDSNLDADAADGGGFNALGVAVRNGERGPLVAAADNIFVNTVPLFSGELRHLGNIDFVETPIDRAPKATGNDANGTGVALGDGFGVVSFFRGDPDRIIYGIQVFRTDVVTDNRGVAPQVTITAPTADTKVKLGFFRRIEALATDDIQVDRVEFLVDGEAELLIDGMVGNVDRTKPFVGFFRPTTTGDLRVRARAFDTGGNQTTSLEVAVEAVEAVAPGTVLAARKIRHPGDGDGHFDRSGRSIAVLGDLDGIGESVQAIAVGAPFDDGAGKNRGAVWIFFIDAAGQILRHHEINGTAGQLQGLLDDGDQFGISVAALGDLDGDGAPEIAVGAWFDDGESGDPDARDFGAVWILSLNPDGTVKDHQKISPTEPPLQKGDRFGSAIANLGDLDGSGRITLAVGAALDDGDGTDRGAVWILFLNANGGLESSQEISADPEIQNGLDDVDLFGYALAPLGDLDGDGVGDLAVGAILDDNESIQAGSDLGAIRILFLNPNGTVREHRKIDAMVDQLGDGKDLFGFALAGLGDLDADGVDELAVSVLRDDDGGSDRGAVWILFLDRNGAVKADRSIKIGSSTTDLLARELGDRDHFGSAVASLGDLDGDGFAELIVGAWQDDDAGGDQGAVWILSLEGPEN